MLKESFFMLKADPIIAKMKNQKSTTIGIEKLINQWKGKV